MCNTASWKAKPEFVLKEDGGVTYFQWQEHGDKSSNGGHQPTLSVRSLGNKVGSQTVILKRIEGGLWVCSEMRLLSCWEAEAKALWLCMNGTRL